MEITDNDNVSEASTDSSPSTEGAEAQTPSLQDAVVSESSTEDNEVAAPEKVFNDTVEKLESGKSPKEAVKDSKVESEAKTDEPADDKTKESDVLSQSEQEEKLYKGFDARPEWQKLRALVPKEKWKQVRSELRGVFQKENDLTKQIEAHKPAVQTYERFERATGGKEYVENTIQLIEEYQKGSPKAREMLMVLLNDLDARTGAVLTSDDLIQRGKQIDEALTQGTMDEAEAKQKRADLLEIQKARVGKQQTEAELKQREQADQKQSFEQVKNATRDAAATWENGKKASDPDYESLREMVEGKAAVLRDQHPEYQKGNIIPPVEAVKILDQAYAWAKEKASKLMPKPKPRNGLNGGGSSATSRRQPANESEAFFQKIEELENHRR